MKRRIFFAAVLALLAWVFTACAEELKLPLCLKTIGAQAFFQDAGLDAVILPDGLERIESEAFAQSSIRQIRLPKTLKYIADDAFQGCGDLSVAAEKGTYAYDWAVRNGWISDESISTVIVPEILEAGENLTVFIEGPYNSIRHTVFLLNDQTKFAETKTLTGQAGAVAWMGYGLEPGEYRVIVYTVTDEYKTLIPINKYVQIQGEKAEGPSLSLPETVQYEGNIEFTPENECLVKAVWYDLEGNQVAQNDLNAMGGKTVQIHNYKYLPYGGYIDICVREYKNGKWTAWGPVSRVTAAPDVSQLAAPVLSAPDTASAGRDLEVSFTEVEHATYYYLYIERNGEMIYKDSQTEQVIIPGHYLSEGEYTLRLYVSSKEGYRDSSVQKTITVFGTQPPAPEISIDKTELLFNSNERANLSIHADGAENAAIRRLVTNYSTGTGYVNLDDSGSGVYSLNGYMYGEPVSVQLSVSVLIDDTWSEWSAPVEVQFKEREPLSAPVISAPEAIENGQDFTFTFDPVEHADYYEARIEAVYGSNTIKSWRSEICKPGTPLTLEGYNLSKGSYYVAVTAYSNEYSSSTAQFRFTVSGTKPGAPEIVCDKEIFHINEKVQFTLYENSAEAFAVKYEGRTNDIYWNSTVNVPAGSGNDFIWNWTAPSSAAGTVFTFSFTCKQNGLWSGWKTLTYEIQDRPQLDAPVIHVQETYQAGENVTITFDAVDNAEIYYVTLYTSDDNWRSWGNTTERVCTIYGYDIDPGTYRVVVEARSSEYRTGTAEAAFAIEGTKPAAPAVSVDKTDVQYREKYTFTIDTANMEALYYKIVYPESGGYSQNSITVLENTTKWTTYSYDEGVRVYQFCALADGKWTAWSDPIAITSQPKPVLEAPVVTAPAVLSQGEDLLVTVSGAENATSYQIQLYNAAGQSILYRNIDQPGEITVPGYRLPLGTLKIHVDAYLGDVQSTGYANTRVIAGNRPAAPAVTPPEKTTVPSGTYLVFSVDGNGAEQAAVRWYPVGETNSVSYNEISISESGTAEWTTWWYSDTAYIYSFCVKKNGVWSQWSSGIEITPE